ncbi:MAG: glycosyltransferase family 2 protein [Clostridia bacterium]|nr:glycosyltransferase family 2 protein [Clostridia bacterium]
MKPILYFVVPCFNEQEVLPISIPIILNKLSDLVMSEMVSEKSKVMFVDDGSRDNTLSIIRRAAEEDKRVCAVTLSRNRGHQNALLAGLMAAKDKCNITISIDCDGQDDINASDEMIKQYLDGCDIVYGVRRSRKSDTFFKRKSARLFYKLLNSMGANTVVDSADYRLLSSKALSALAEFKEVNLYLRGMVSLVGFKSTCVYYDRTIRQAGESKYSLGKMLSLALNGITSFSVRPIRIITAIGFIIAAVSFIGIIWSVIARLAGNTVGGWVSTVAIICFLGGIQILSSGIIGEYIGKIYLETKQRPRYIVDEKINID